MEPGARDLDQNRTQYLATRISGRLAKKINPTPGQGVKYTAAGWSGCTFYIPIGEIMKAIATMAALMLASSVAFAQAKKEEPKKDAPKAEAKKPEAKKDEKKDAKK